MSESPASIESIVLDAIKLDGQERASFLDDACGEDVELRQRVERLLDARSKVEGFLESPAAEMGATLERMNLTLEYAESDSSEESKSIGPYKILQPIGEGGFGVVYMAEQIEPIRRKVAIKVIKPGMDSKEVIARFEAERQALAMMDHPNIAKILDGGTTESGRPYFVMELVNGVPVNEFCDENAMSTHDRLNLFGKVCQAVHHAHQKGIIHRDLKPSNVLVTIHDNQPVPKVIDFGVSKAIGQQLTDKTLFTAFGQMVGTPIYMSPEQAQIGGLDIDTRSDIYSLGIILFELLTGSTPLEMERIRKSAFAEMQRLIREEEAPRPSFRLSSDTNEAQTRIAKKRGTSAKDLNSQLRKDLDWVVKKALEKDRNRRYDSAQGLADDVQRFLKGEAVEACPPSTAYRVGKYVRRHRTVLTVAATIVFLIIAGATASTYLAFLAYNNWKDADEKSEKLMVSLNESKKAKEAADAARLESDIAKYAAVIRLADPEFSKSSFDEARELLASTPESLRGWEYDRLHTVWNSKSRWIGVEHEFLKVDVSADGNWIAGGVDGPEVHLYKFENGSGAGELRTEGNRICELVFQPDGEELVVASDRSIHVWDLTSRKQLGKLAVPEVPASLVYQVGETTNREYVERIIAENGPALAIDPNTGRIAFSMPGAIQIWDRELSTMVSQYTWDTPGFLIQGMEFTPDGSKVIASRNRLRNVKTENGLETILGAGFVAIDPVTGKLIWTRDSESFGFMGGGIDGDVVRTSADGKWFIGRNHSEMGKLSFQNTKDGTVTGHMQSGVLTGCFELTDRFVFHGFNDRDLNVVDIATGKTIARLASPPEPDGLNKAGYRFFTHLSVSKDGQRLAACFGTRNQKIKETNTTMQRFGLVCWDLNDKTATKTIGDHSQFTQSQLVENSFGSAVKTLNYGYLARTVTTRHFAPLSDGRSPQSLPHKSIDQSIELVPLDRQGSSHALLRETDVSERQVIKGRISSALEAPLLAVARRNKIEIWNLESKVKEKEKEFEESIIGQVVLSPNGKLAIVVLRDPTEPEKLDIPADKWTDYSEIVWWDIENGNTRVIERLEKQEGKSPYEVIRQIAFSPSGNHYLLAKTRMNWKIQPHSMGSHFDPFDMTLEIRNALSNALVRKNHVSFNSWNMCFATKRNEVYITNFDFGVGHDKEKFGLWRWDWDKGNLQRVFKGLVRQVVCSPDGSRLVLRCLPNEHSSTASLLFVEPTTYQVVHEIQLDPDFSECNFFFSHDGKDLYLESHGRIQNIYTRQ